jgi:hypothetical protein
VPPRGSYGSYTPHDGFDLKPGPSSESLGRLDFAFNTWHCIGSNYDLCSLYASDHNQTELHQVTGGYDENKWLSF